MPDPRINLKDPWLAALLAWLVPGGGHFYQGRMFKGIVFFACILGTFTYGLALGDWQSVYFQTEKPAQGRKRAYGYFAQVGAGLPALPALIQYRRFYSESNNPQTALDAPLKAPFLGEFDGVDGDGAAVTLIVRGEIDLSPSKGQYGPEATGSFTGVSLLEKGGERPVTLRIGQPGEAGAEGDAARGTGSAVKLAPPVGPDAGRLLDCYTVTGDGAARGSLRGTIPRPLLDRMQCPLEDDALQRLHDRLGKQFELALVFTWIAGLLNSLAIWDAFEGPAYGYGDEPAPGDGEAGAAAEKASSAATAAKGPAPTTSTA